MRYWWHRLRRHRVTHTDWVKTTVIGVTSTTVHCNTCGKGWKQTRVRHLDPAEDHQISVGPSPSLASGDEACCVRPPVRSTTPRRRRANRAVAHVSGYQ